MSRKIDHILTNVAAKVNGIIISKKRKMFINADIVPGIANLDVGLEASKEVVQAIY